MHRTEEPSLYEGLFIAKDDEVLAFQENIRGSSGARVSLILHTTICLCMCVRYVFLVEMSNSWLHRQMTMGHVGCQGSGQVTRPQRNLPQKLMKRAYRWQSAGMLVCQKNVIVQCHLPLMLWTHTSECHIWCTVKNQEMWVCEVLSNSLCVSWWLSILSLINQTWDIIARTEPLPWRNICLPHVFAERIGREGKCHFLLHGCCLQVISLCQPTVY